MPCLRSPALSIAQCGFMQLYQRVTKTRNPAMKTEVVRELPSRLPATATKPVSPIPASLPPADLSQRHLNQKVMASFSTLTACVAKFKGFHAAKPVEKGSDHAGATVVTATEMLQQPLGRQVGLPRGSGLLGRYVCTTKTTRSG